MCVSRALTLKPGSRGPLSPTPFRMVCSAPHSVDYQDFGKNNLQDILGDALLQKARCGCGMQEVLRWEC